MALLSLRPLSWRAPLSWRLARRELRGGLKGFRIFLACLALGVAAISGVGNLSQALVEGLRADGAKILGGDVELRLTHRPWNVQQEKYLRGEGTVSQVIGLRTMARAGATGQNSNRALVELKGVDGLYPLYGEMTLQRGGDFNTALARADGRWGAVVEATLVRRLGLSIGESLKIGDAEFVLRGVIAKEPDRGGSGFTLGPRVMVAHAAMADTGLIREGSLVRYRYRLKLPEGSDLVAWLVELNERFPRAGWRIRDVRNGAPGLHAFVNRMQLFLTLVGLSALLVGGLGIANAVKSYLDGKISVIATLKCVGAPSNLIFSTYLLQILALALGGIAVGLAVGTLTPVLLGDLVSSLLPFDARIGIYWKPTLLAAIFGLLTAATFSYWPLARARGVPAAALFRNVTEPLSARINLRQVMITAAFAEVLAILAIFTAAERRFAVYFVIGAILAFGLFFVAGLAVQWVAKRVPRPRSTALRLAIANLHRPGAATLGITISFGLGLSVLVTVAALRANIQYQVSERLPNEAPAFFFLDILPSQAKSFASAVRQVAGENALNTAPSMRGRIMRIKGTPVEEITPDPSVAWVLRGDRGITYSAVPPAGSTIVEGKWWPKDYAGPLLLSFDATAARGLGLAIGDHITVNILGREFRAEIANFRRIDWTTMGINFVMVFSPGMLSSAPHSFVATAHADESQERALENRIAADFPNVTTIRIREVLATVNGILENISLAIRAVAAVTLVAGVLVLAGAIAAGHRRRVYDAVVLKVLGATRRRLIGTFLMEYLFLGGLTAVLSGFVGGLSSYLIVTYLMHARWHFPAGAIAMVMVFALVVTVLAGVIATWAALSQKPAPLLRNE